MGFQPLISGFNRHIVEPGKGPLFLLLLAFLVTFTVTRIYTRLARTRGWGSLQLREVHVHHLVVGVILLLVSGTLAFAVTDQSVWQQLDAVAFGVGAAFTLDEFALWFYLDDVYWSEEGRRSVDATVVAVLILLILLYAASPFGVPGIHTDEQAPRALVVLYLGMNAVFVAVTLLKGKLKLGVLAIVIGPIGVIAAMRLARPTSPWAHWFYRDPAEVPQLLRPFAHNGRSKLIRARRRIETGRVARWERRAHDIIGGAPHLPSPRRRGR